MTKWIKSKVLDIKKWQNNLFKLVLENNIDSYIPGQFTRLAVRSKSNNNFIYGFYSFVSSPKEKKLEFYLLRVDNGYLSNIFYNLNINDYIFVSKKSSGVFTLKNVHKCQTLWMICSGSAIGPYISILNHDINIVKNLFQNIIFLYSIKYCSDFNYLDKFLYLRKLYGKKFFKILTFVSREKNSISKTLKFNGRISTFFLNKNIFNLFKISSKEKDNHFMICGNILMIKDIINILNNVYKIKNNITLEKY